MGQEELKVGLIGVGRKALTIDDETRWLVNYDLLPCSHAAAYTAHPRTRVVAVANPGEDAATAYRERFGAVRDYRTAGDMLAAEELDLVSICTHARHHAEMTLAAARAGVRGILCEKAMATSLDECRQMLATCREHGAQLVINHPRRYHPTFREARRLLAEGAIGEIKLALCTGYGKLMHNGSHTFDVLHEFFGPAAWVQGELVATEDHDDPDGRGVVRFHNGVVAYIDFAAGQPFSFSFSGTGGSVVLDQWQEGLELIQSELQDQSPGRPWFSYSPQRAARRRYELPQRRLVPMLGAVDDMVQAVAGKGEPHSRGEDGYAAVEMAVGMHLSHQQGGARITLPLGEEHLSRQVISR